MSESVESRERWPARAVTAMALLVGCADPTPTPAANRVVQVEREAVKMPGPAPRARDGDPVARNADCEHCHEAIAAEWRGSQHQTAYTDFEFQRAFKHEPLPFCRGCHAPEAEPRRAPPKELGELGIGCVSCHLVEGQILAAPLAPGTTSAAPHPVKRAEEFGSPAACASCHEFPFPGRNESGALMQTTIQEHAASPASDRSCADCHMPEVTTPSGTHRSHRFEVTRDREWLRRAVSVKAARVGAEVTLTLTAGDVGHAVPTGDINRRLAIWARPVDRERVRQRRYRYLTRHFVPDGSGGPITRRETSDDRVIPGTPTVVQFEFPDAGGLPVEWAVVHERVEAFLSPRERDAIITGAVVIDSGELPAT